MFSQEAGRQGVAPPPPRDLSTTSTPSASDEPADYAIDKAIAGQGLALPAMRIDARRNNGHAQDPMQDGLVILEQEHDAISEAMQAVIAGAEAWCKQRQGNPEQVDTLLSQLVALVSQHASLEERYVYPLFRDYLKGTVQGVSADLIYERNIVDDNMNKEVMDLLLKMRLARDGELMLATLKKLQQIEDEHLTQEEHWFALLRSQMAAADLRSLADTMRSAASTAPTRPHSLVGPSHALPAKLAHPVAGVLDRALDKATGRDIGLETREGGAKQVAAVAHKLEERAEKEKEEF